MWKLSVVPSLFAGLVLSLLPTVALPTVAAAGVFLSVRIAPPALEVYQQPLCPTDGYIWTPGYWGYGNAGYYWIPGAWMAPPQAGYLWTPGYWGFSDGLYAFNAGYWGPTVGFYGGVNYGFGYGGNGYDGGRWQGGHFSYNTAVSHVNTSVIHNTYSQNAGNHGNNRTSFNGGPGGISARPSSAETATARQHGQGASAPAAQQRASVGGPAQARQATPAARPETANNRGAEPQSRTVARTTTPSAARPEERQAASAPRAAPQQAQRAAPREEPRQIASNRSSAPSRPATQQEQRPQATRAAAPQQHAAPQQRAAAPQQHAAAPQQHAAAARPAEGREEKK